MSLVDLERLRQGSPGCPSDVMLHRLRAGELHRILAEALRRHLEACERCAALAARHAAGFGAWPEVDPVRMLAAVRRRVAGARARSPSPIPSARSLAHAPLAPLAPLAAAASALLQRRSSPRE